MLGKDIESLLKAMKSIGLHNQARNVIDNALSCYLDDELSFRKKELEEYFTKNPHFNSKWAFHMKISFKFGSDIEWAKDIIKKDNTQDGMWACILSCVYKKEIKWAETIIKERKDSKHAYLMVKDNGSDREWAEEIIEEANDIYHAHLMVKECGSAKKWAEKIKDKKKEENSDTTVYTAKNDENWEKTF